MQGETGARKALAFTASPESPNYAGQRPLDEVAACLSEACGHGGTGAEHLLQTGNDRLALLELAAPGQLGGAETAEAFNRQEYARLLSDAFTAVRCRPQAPSELAASCLRATHFLTKGKVE